MNYIASVSIAAAEIRKRVQTVGKRPKRAGSDVFAGLDPTLVQETALLQKPRRIWVTQSWVED
jgi:hypothetical protein